MLKVQQTGYGVSIFFNVKKMHVMYSGVTESLFFGGGGGQTLSGGGGKRTASQ